MHIIRIHAEAPPKPAWGAPCNGCGVCCLAEPCPVGIVVSGRRHGACRALRWVDAEQRYRCGVVLAPGEGVPGRGPAWLQRWIRRAALRLIAAGHGCDSDATLE